MFVRLLLLGYRKHKRDHPNDPVNLEKDLPELFKAIKPLLIFYYLIDEIYQALSSLIPVPQKPNEPDSSASSTSNINTSGINPPPSTPADTKGKKKVKAESTWSLEIKKN